MSMADALAKAGLITKDRANQVEKEKLEKTPSIQEEPRPQRRREPQPQVNSNNVEHEKFNRLWHGEQSKKFMRHLVWAYTPHTKVDRIWQFGDGQEKKCCLCHTEILSVQDAINAASESMSDTLLARCRFEIENKDRCDEDFQKEHEAFYKEMHQQTFGGRFIGNMSPESSKVICAPCYTAFNDWIMNMMLRGDTVMHSMIRKLRMRAIDESN